MPEWKRIRAGRHRCERCGTFFEGEAWKYFPQPNVFTHVLCPPCVEEVVEADDTFVGGHFVHIHVKEARHA